MNSPSHIRKLFLIPSTLGDSEPGRVIPPYNLEIIQSLTHFVVEEEKTARRFLIRCGYKRDLNEVYFYLLNEHTPDSEIPFLFSDSGESHLGLISEAGLPAVADPGAQLVREACRRNITVVPLAGPSSLMLALMASGLNGQQFAFNGYLPVKPQERAARIKYYEKQSETCNQTQIFIEAPYRNNRLIEALLANLKPGTSLCIAANLTLTGEWIKTRTVGEWKQNPPHDLKKIPVVYLFYSGRMAVTSRL